MRALPTTLLSLTLLLGCSAVEAPVEAPDPEHGREPLLHVHVPTKVVEGAGRFKADWSFDLVELPGWSTHVHVIPKGQLVPPHHHPENEELAWVAGGQGEWTSWTKSGGASEADILGAGAIAVAPATAVHSVRNRQDEPLAVVVLQRPSFGQNWNLLPEDVESEVPSGSLGPDEALPEGFLAGWQLGTERGGAVARRSSTGDTLYLVRSGSGRLRFEAQDLPLEAGHFVHVPPGLEHEIVGVDGLGLYSIQIPR